jgi:chemotaxis protein CheD
MLLPVRSISEHFLFPSTLFASLDAYRVQTILGSCISVCLFDPYLKIGGINHYMLPWWNGDDMPSPKFGNIAIQRLIEKLNGFGCRTENLSAKIFGGANQHGISNSIAISKRNIETARSMLGDYRIAITAESVGGDSGRKIVFQTSTNQVWMKTLGRTDFNDIRERN